jgi:uncharacterized membrane protein YozB (DUF420 family)
MTDLILSAATFTAVLLLYGAWRIKQRDGATKQMWLMIAASAVIFMNLAIWITPVENGKSLINQKSINDTSQ